MTPRLTNDISNRLMQEAATMTEESDDALTEALEALTAAAPQCRRLIMALEEAASARRKRLGRCVLYHRPAMAANPALVLLEN